MRAWTQTGGVADVGGNHAGRRDERAARDPRRGRLDHGPPDRRGAARTGDVAHGRAVRIADPNADHPVGREADGPAVAEARAAARLHRGVERRVEHGVPAKARDTRDRVAEDVRQQVRELRGKHLRAELRPTLVEDLAAPVEHALDRVRLGEDPAGGQRSVRGGKVEQRHFAGTEDQRQSVRLGSPQRVEAEAVRDFEQRLLADLVERPYRRHVERGGESDPNRDRAPEAQIEVHRLVETERSVEAARDVQHHRRRGVAALEGCRVEEGLQGRARLAWLDGHVDLPRRTAAEVRAADHRQHAPVRGVEDHHRGAAGLAILEQRKPRTDRSLGLALEVAVEGCLDDQVVAGREIGPQRPQLVEDVADEVRGEGLALGREHGKIDSRRLGGLRGRDHAVGLEPAQHIRLAGAGALGMYERVEAGALRQPGKQARLREIELARRDAEVGASRRLDAVGAAAVVDLVEVGLEDLVFRVVRLELEREQRLARLAERQRVAGVEVERARELLRDGRCAGTDGRERRGRAHDRQGVDPGVLPEALVLGCDRRGDGDGSDVLEADRDVEAVRGLAVQHGAFAIEHHRPARARALIDRR